MRRANFLLKGTGAVLIWLLLVGTTLAQTNPGDHSAHHPNQAVPPPGTLAQPSPGGANPLPPVPGAAPSTQASPGCGGMMACMGAGQRPFYASLLDMPTLTPEARRFIEAEAQRRIGWGSQATLTAQARLQQALASNDTAAVQQATAGLREGLSILESGTAALRTLEVGTPPRQFALAWFRSQLGSSIGTVSMVPSDGVWGLSWYHLTTMAFLVAFLIGALLIQYARMRRVGGLVQRLKAASVGAAPGLAAAAGKGASNPAPVAPHPTGTAALLMPGAVSGPTRADFFPRCCLRDSALAVAAAKRPWSGMLRLAAVFPETPNVKTFRLVVPDGGDIPFTFMPGQFLIFSAEIDGNRVRRSYTLASSPTQRSYVEVTIKREEQGLISRYLHDSAAVGSLLEVSAPAGVFTFTGGEADSIVLIAGGVGITPMMSITRYLIDRSYPGEIFFLYGARTIQDFIFREELEYLQKRHANLYIAATMSHAEGTAWMGATGLISKEFIARAVPEITRRRIHLCGPPPMMEAVTAALVDLGVPKEQVRTEAFGPARGVAPGPHAPFPVAALAPGAAPASTTASNAVPRIATAEVQFTKSGKTGPLAPDQSVLEAAEAIGVSIDYACRVGICGICKVPLLEGEVTMEVEEGLPADEKARGLILACQAKSMGNLVVEA